jgi:hypothetical protein
MINDIANKMMKAEALRDAGSQTPIVTKVDTPKFAVAKNIQHFLDGQSIYDAIVYSVDQLRNTAPEDCDTLIQAFGLTIDKVTFHHPHTLIFSGTDDLHHRTEVVAHYTQVIVQITYVPRVDPNVSRVIGFHTFGDTIPNQ